MVQRVKIAAIVPYPIYPAKMGGQKGIALFYDHLNKILPVTIITVNNQNTGEFKGEIITSLGKWKWRYANPLLIKKIKKIFAGNQYSHLILEHPYFGWLGILLKRSCNLSLVIHSHNIESLRFKSTGRWWWKLLWQYEKFIHRKADTSFFITETDRQFAIHNFKLKAETCHTITYGCELKTPPVNEERIAARAQLEETYHILPGERILLFNGTLSYQPNLDALEVILKKIHPILQKKEYPYKIIICGKGLPMSYNELKEWSAQNIIYAGFVTDIAPFFKGADIFINPVIEGGGIKTKVVEALSCNMNVISTASGAIGIPVEFCGNKLSVAIDGDWNDFTAQIIASDSSGDIPNTFFEHFYWGNIVRKVETILKSNGS